MSDARDDLNFNFDLYRDLGYTIIVLPNYDHPAARPVVKKAQETISLAARG